MCYSNILKILGFCKYPVIVYLMAQCGYDLMIVYFDCTCYIFGLFSIKDELWSNLLLFSIFFSSRNKVYFPQYFSLPILKSLIIFSAPVLRITRSDVFELSTFVLLYCFGNI